MAEKQEYHFIREYCEGEGQKFAGLVCQFYEAVEQICLLLQKLDIETLWKEGRCTWDMVYGSLESCLQILKATGFSYLPLDEAEEEFNFQNILDQLLYHLGEKRASEIQQKGLAALPGWKGFIRKTVYNQLKAMALKKYRAKYRGETFRSIDDYEATDHETVSKETSESAAENIARFQLTEKAFTRLKAENLPGEILNALKPLIGREFIGHDEFVEALVERIGAEAASQYRDLLLKRAEKKKSVSQYSIELLKERAEQENLTPKRKEKYERQLHLFREMIRLLSTFEFHEETFQKLLKDGVPESILQQLRVLQQIQYPDQHSFLDAVEQILGEKETSRYAKRILNRAGYSENQAKRELTEAYYDGQDRQLRRDWEEIREYLQEKMSVTDVA